MPQRIALARSADTTIDVPIPMHGRRDPSPFARLAAWALLPGACLCLAGKGVHAQTTTAPGVLPPPPRSADMAGEALVHLELVLNRLPTGRVVPVALREGHYFLDARHLHDLHVRGVAADAGDVAVDQLDGVRVAYDSARLRLLIDVPAAWLPPQTFGGATGLARHPARSSAGMVFNYDAFVTAPDHGRSSASLWNEVRAFGRFGMVSSTGAWRDRGGYVRYDTRWQFSDEERMLTWEAGDVVTRGLAWTSAVRMGGVQLSRDFSVRPDVITYPLPQFAGEAAVPTAVDLFVNGHRTGSTQVAPGPFSLTNVPFVNGAGEAVIVVTDALGRQVSTTVPFYVSSELLRPGLSDFAAGLGAIRRGYGLRNFAYGEAVTQGSYRRGLHELLTVEAHGEAAESFALAGLGGVLRIGQAGVVNLAYSHGRHDGRSGQQASMGYQYGNRRFHLATQYNRRSRDFVDLAVLASPTMRSGVRSNVSASAGVALGEFGSLGLGYVDIEGHDAERTRLATLSWGLSPWRGASLYASANRELDSDDWSAALHLVVSLDPRRGSFGAGIERHRDRGDVHRVHYSRSVPSDGGFGWNLAYAHADADADYRQADLSWRNDHVQLRGGLYARGDEQTRWANASGALVVMDGSLFAANRISDAFVVVDANGHAGVPIRYENQRIGTTNGAGRLLIPWASAYYGGKYEIDPMQLPANVRTPLVEQRVAVRRGAGYLLRFPVERVAAASLVLHDTEGRPLPVGAIVRSADGRQTYVGWDGLVYLEGVQATNTLDVTLPDGRACSVDFAVDTTADRVSQLGPLTCR